MEQALRRITIRMEASGTAHVIENTKVYQDSYRFVGLRAFVPITANRITGVTSGCTVHATIEDNFGVKKTLGNKYYQMYPAGIATINGFEYIVFERNMPADFTASMGDLTLTFVYSEITAEGKLYARLPSCSIKTTVEEGGEPDGEIDVEIDDQMVQFILDAGIQIDELKRQYIELRQSTDFLFQPIDNSHTNIVGNARVEITPEGRLAFIELKGEKGDTPYIAANGHWWVSGIDTGVKAQGDRGDTPHIGINGHWWIVDFDTGVKAQGDTGAMGPMPNHFWQGSVIHFQKPDGTYDEGTNISGGIGIPGPSVAAGMQVLMSSSEMWSHDSASGYFYRIITPDEHRLGETPNIVVSCKPVEDDGYIQTADSVTISNDGVIGLTSRVPWNGLIHVMGGATEATDYLAREQIEQTNAKYDALIPNQATADNQLADKEFVNSSIMNIAANRVYYNAAGDNFPTRAAIMAANSGTTVYRDGKAYTPSKDDYAIVTSDEGAPEHYTGGQTRWTYSGTLWTYDFGINSTPFTAAQNAAINSGATTEKINEIATKITKAQADTYYAPKGESYTKTESDNKYELKDTAYSKAVSDGKYATITNTYSRTETEAKFYQKPTSGIPKSDLASDVQTALNNANSAIQAETDPTVPAWAKAATKPTYTAADVGAVPTSRTVNGKALSANISLTASDVGAVTSSQVDEKINTAVTAALGDIESLLAGV